MSDEIVDETERDAAACEAQVASEGRLSEARHLVALAQAGDRAARDLVVEGHLGLVTAIARRYATPRVPLADLVQEGTIGLLRAITKFSVAHGVQFSTYAGWWIWQAVS